jgi:hypothetical protein
MPSFEVGLRTEFGTVSLHFQDISELEALISQLPDVVNRVQKIAKDIVPETIPPVEPGLEHVYANLPGNLTKLFRVIGNKADTVTFVLNTKHPYRMSLSQAASSIGLTTEDVRKIIQNAKYRNRFVGDQNLGFSVSDFGRRFVQEEIKPKLLRERTEEEKKTA